MGWSNWISPRADLFQAEQGFSKENQDNSYKNAELFKFIFFCMHLEIMVFAYLYNLSLGAKNLISEKLNSRVADSIRVRLPFLQ